MKLPQKIEAERIILKGLNKPSFRLATALYAAVDSSRTSLREWLPWPDKMHAPEDEYAYLVNWAHAHWKEGTGFAYLIQPKKQNIILGCIDILKISDTHKSGEIGYWLVDTAAGHGYMQEAVRALESAAFTAGLNRIIIRNDTHNQRSINVTKRTGYTLEGIMRQDAWDDFHKCMRDTNLWSKLKAEWEKQNTR